MGNYYCLIAGLPELHLDDRKLHFSMKDFRDELYNELALPDWKKVQYFYMRYDNENILKILKNSDAEIDPLGNYSAETLLEFIQLFKEVDQPCDDRLFRYFNVFIPAWLNEEPVFEGLELQDQLNSLYYDYAMDCSNKFIASWFEFNLNVSNILTAINCRKYKIDRTSAIVGSNEVAELLRISNARDFDLSPIFPEVEEVMGVAAMDNLYERELKIDRLKWEWLEENGFFHYFDLEHLFMYLVKLDMLHRWLKLSRETGEVVFREMIDEMQHSFEFPNDFTVKKVR